ncbi:hypothetical protein LX36DRAFT_483664 [Colletotrichum falcatum]|nr:hypothetical protein LX36DRAFT_483664 [Colletotrichum falcatum]
MPLLNFYLNHLSHINKMESSHYKDNHARRFRVGSVAPVHHKKEPTLPTLLSLLLNINPDKAATYTHTHTHTHTLTYTYICKWQTQRHHVPLTSHTSMTHRPTK